MTPTIGLIAFAAALVVPFLVMTLGSHFHQRRRIEDSTRNLEDRMAANWRPASVTQLPTPAVAADQKLAA